MTGPLAIGAFALWQNSAVQTQVRKKTGCIACQACKLSGYYYLESIAFAVPGMPLSEA
jgi:hypothetical protein